MAIFSLNHKAIGKTSQDRPYTAAAHVNYITRPKAMSRLEGARMPVSKGGAMGFFRSAEDRDRKNGRVADKVMLALPVELTPDQRVELLRGFADQVTDGRASWLAAFHDKGKDSANPHCHLLIRDRDPETGRRVFGMSEKGSTQRLRLLWEAHANQALEKAGRPERIDHRTLEAQGKPGPAGIHEGPKPRAMARGGRRPRSRARTVRNAPGAHREDRRIAYPTLDQGRTRPVFNRELQALREAEGWEAVDADNRRREMNALRDIHKRPADQLADANREEERMADDPDDRKSRNVVPLKIPPTPKWSIPEMGDAFEGEDPGWPELERPPYHKSFGWWNYDPDHRQVYQGWHDARSREHSLDEVPDVAALFEQKYGKGWDQVPEPVQLARSPENSARAPGNAGERDRSGTVIRPIGPVAYDGAGNDERAPPKLLNPDILSFSEQLARQRNEKDQNPAERTERDARDLERMRQSRETDKDRER